MNKAEIPWAHHSHDVIHDLGGHGSHGLKESQIDSKRNQFGKNLLSEKKRQSNVLLFLRQFKSPMVYTLFAAALIALLLGEWLDAGAIFAILILNSVISYIHESKANTAIEALRKMSVPKARLIRDGKTLIIPSEDVVPGDLLHFEAGDYVAADARILEAFQLTVDEAPLTGESMPVKKHSDIIKHDAPLADRKNMLHSGTAISTGSGKAIVTSTGMKTEIGKIAGMLEETPPEETPLQKRLEVVSHRLIMLGFIVILIVIAIHYFQDDPWYLTLMSAISLAVAAIPEGLPTVVTLALTIAVRRMTKRNAIVRNIGAVETLGSTDFICTDKTGTLTAGKMSVSSVFSKREDDQFLKAMILCNNASIDGEVSGDPTEVALLIYAEKKGFSVREIKRNARKIHEWSFDSNRKRMSVLCEESHQSILYVKGAPETMLERCELEPSVKNELRGEIHSRSSRGERLLLVAQRCGHYAGESEDVERELTFLGLVSISDPPKPETIPAIKECQEAGIRVVMITGDHPVTALAIANDLGITIRGSFEGVMTGAEIEALSFEELRKKVEHTAVYARVSPAHKMTIVTALQANGHIVAMTGDGVNDAPALKKAEIGVAMGKSGTEVARQASKMILTDDNFSTIVSAVEEGRAIFGNIKRTIQYLLSTNLAEILIVLGASLLGLPVPFVPLGLLWINLVTDGLPSLALAAEPLEKDILKSSRRPSPTSFFDRDFITEMIFTGILITLTVLGYYFFCLQTLEVTRAKSLAFNLMVLMCLFRSLTCRSESKTFFELEMNYYLLFSIIAPLLAQYFLQFTDWYLRMFELVRLDVKEFAVLIALALVPPTLVEIHKIWRRKIKV